MVDFKRKNKQLFVLVFALVLSLSFAVKTSFAEEDVEYGGLEGDGGALDYEAQQTGWSESECRASGGVWENGDCYESGSATDCSSYGPGYYVGSDGNCYESASDGGSDYCTSNAECIRDYGAGYFCDTNSGFCDERSGENRGDINTATGDICFTDSECAWHSRCKLGKNGATGVCQYYTDFGESQSTIDTLLGNPTGSTGSGSSRGLTVNIPGVGTRRISGVVSNPVNLGGYNFPSGTQLFLNGNGTGVAMAPSGEVISSSVPASVVQQIQGSSSFRSNGGGSGGSGSGFPAGSVYVQQPKCGFGFEDVGGVCFPTNTGLSNAPIYVILGNIFGWLMGLFTTLAVIAFVISGIQYLTSAGDEKQSEKAKNNAKYAIYGIIVGLSGYLIVKAIATALSGQSIFF